MTTNKKKDVTLYISKQLAARLININNKIITNATLEMIIFSRTNVRVAFLVKDKLVIFLIHRIGGVRPITANPTMPRHRQY